MNETEPAHQIDIVSVLSEIIRKFERYNSAVETKNTYVDERQIKIDKRRQQIDPKSQNFGFHF